MSQGLTTVAYIGAIILFILSLSGLANPASSRRGNMFGMIGMALAVLATIFGPRVTAVGIPWIIGAMVVGGGIGVFAARTVKMTQMPELVALMHSLVGLAACLVGFASYIDPAATVGATDAEKMIHEVEIYIGILIGAVTFAGSIIAFGKLSGKIGGKPLLLPGRHLLNLAGLLVVIFFGWKFIQAHSIAEGMTPLIVMTVIALLFGVHMVMAIGGADMPVVVSMLNSYSGWAAAAIGFTLGNDLLIVTGALVGSSGAILSYIMCKAMNRSFISVILGGFGGPAGPQMEISGEQIAIDADGVAAALDEADSVIIIPGYGMAVAQAQQSVSELTRRLRAKGKTVRFAIHPVAGRLPGHMNVLLAEARVPYDIVMEMDEINDDFPTTDVAIVIGSNDIVNPAAQDDPNSPIAGMPVLECWKAKQVFVSKRGQGTGYSGIENPLFFKDNTRMFYGDAKKSLDELLTKIS